jgi:ribosomal protein S18 acetylase RimI-like enzyme
MNDLRSDASRLAYRSAEAADAHAVSDLVRATFRPETLPGWTAKAVEKLFEENSAAAFDARLESRSFTHVCLSDGSVVGYIDCKLPRLLSLLVVHPSFQRLGIGSQLLDRALEHIASTAPDVSVVEVNATEYSVPFYRRRSFYPLSEFIEHGGCRFVRMGFWRKSPLLTA